jgi:hypothetical protein
MNPSLLLIPDRYKASKLYSQIPDSGAGDLAFTRALDTATRVNSAGLIEKVRTNRFTYSQDIANADWKTATDGGSITKTANAGTAPDGTNTASRVQVAGGGTYSLVYQDNVNPLGRVVISGFFKRYGGTNQTFRLFGDNGSALSSTLTATDTWQRFSFVMTASSAGADGLAADASNNAYDILVWGMQLETGDIATDYIPTTTAAVSVGPVANIPRIDYTGGGCGKLLLEPQRTNINGFIESGTGNFTTATVTNPTNPLSILGLRTFRVEANYGLGDAPHINNNASLSSGLIYTASAYFDLSQTNDTSVEISIFGFGTPNGSAAAIINVSTKAVTTTAAAGAWSNPIGTATLVSGSIYRLSITATALQTFASSRLYVATSNNSKFMECAGIQLEQGSYPTSFISKPTTASVTRSADSASKTGISSLIGATEGTIYGEFTFTGISPQMHMFVSVAGSFANAVYVQTFSATGISMQVWNGVVNQVAINSSGLTAGQNVKFAAAYKANDFALYVNGVQVGTDTSGSVPSGLSQLEVGGYAEAGSPFNFNSSIQTAALYPVRLTNAELATLTSL